MIYLLLLLGASLSDGLAAVRAGDYEAARRNFAAFASERPSDPAVAQATLWLARLEADPTFGLYQQATTKFKQLLSLYPATPLIAEINYWLGVCYVILGDSSTAAVHFRETRSRGAGSIWATLALTELEGIGEVSVPSNGGTATGGYAVQVGSFTDPDRAEKLLREYEGEGRSGEIRQVTIAGKLYYRVWLGPFATQEEASAYAGSLKAQGKAAMVVKR
jgi:tetratricopeptide (TPR) repeat protein